MSFIEQTAQNTYTQNIEAAKKEASIMDSAFQAALDTNNKDTVLWTRELRRRANKTQAQMAESLSVSPHVISTLEAGKARPNDSDLRTKLTLMGQNYGMPPLPEPRLGERAGGGPYFASTLEVEFSRMFGAQASQ